jgi:hypothetical protein
VVERIFVERSRFADELRLRLEGRDGAFDLLQHDTRVVVGDVAGGPCAQLVGKLAQPVDALLGRPVVAVEQILDLAEAHRLADVHLLVGVARPRVLRQHVSEMTGRGGHVELSLAV